MSADRCAGGKPPLLPTGDPRIFGPPVWKTLHILAQNYPRLASRDTRRKCKCFLFSLSYLLPCSHCGKHFRSFLRRSNVSHAIKRRKSLVALLVRAHAVVASHTRPGVPHMSVACATKAYSFMRAPHMPLTQVWIEDEAPSRCEESAVPTEAPKAAPSAAVLAQSVARQRSCYSDIKLAAGI